MLCYICFDLYTILQLSRVVLESYCPFFKKKDLRLSRIKEPDRAEILLFKRLDWQVLRIEAKSRDNHANGLPGDIPLTPLRLITNQGCCKMTIKKKLNGKAFYFINSYQPTFINYLKVWIFTFVQCSHWPYPNSLPIAQFILICIN